MIEFFGSSIPQASTKGLDRIQCQVHVYGRHVARGDRYERSLLVDCSFLLGDWITVITQAKVWPSLFGCQTII